MVTSLIRYPKFMDRNVLGRWVNAETETKIKHQDSSSGNDHQDANTPCWYFPLQELANIKLNGRSLVYHLDVIMRTEKTLRFELFKDFYEEIFSEVNGGIFILKHTPGLYFANKIFLRPGGG